MRLGSPFDTVPKPRQVCTFCLKRIVESDQERMLDIEHEHITLAHQMTRFIAFTYVRLGEHLDGIRVPVTFVHGQIHLAKTALADHF